MRILAIGLGGAGCRIINSLYATDRRSSKVACVQALAIDVNSDTLTQLGSLPEDAKLFFPPVDPDLHSEEDGDAQTATIDIGEIASRVQNFESGETDAIFVCCGLGGSMVDVAPHIIASLRSTSAEPIFGLVTLPCLAEGERRSAKAADDIEMLSPLLDGIILFDNETWYKKTKAQRSTLVKKEKGLAEKLGFRKSEPEISPELATYLLLNEAIVRRISLILRAGEFKADGGLDLAEVVLDSGEVLNTMKGMGFITIGYAVERLPQHPLSFLTNLHPTGLFQDAHKIKASRIVGLAKQAIYHEISTPCDMTSAHKALILIAGPSHELSMKGFMTVRKWIDRSIAGLETRSGDYPVMNTKNVAIIIMLSGLENIPRITEIREIQTQYKSTHQESRSPLNQLVSGIISTSDHVAEVRDEIGASPLGGEKIVRDEMLVLPLKSRKTIGVQDSGEVQQPKEYFPAERNETQQSTPPYDPRYGNHFAKERTGDNTLHPLTAISASDKSVNQSASADTEKMKREDSDGLSKRLATRSQDNRFAQSSPHRLSSTLSHNKKTTLKDSREEASSHTINERLRTKEMERQIIERELQRQRTMAISSNKPKTVSQASPEQPTEIVRIKRELSKRTFVQNDTEQVNSAEVSPMPQAGRKVIIRKKKVHSEEQETHVQNMENQDISGRDENSSAIMKHSSESDSERMEIESAHKSKDYFGGKNTLGFAVPQVRDSALIHTNLKSKKKSVELKGKDSSENVDLSNEAFKTSEKREKNTSKKDDISWI